MGNLASLRTKRKGPLRRGGSRTSAPKGEEMFQTGKASSGATGHTVCRRNCKSTLKKAVYHLLKGVTTSPGKKKGTRHQSTSSLQPCHCPVKKKNRPSGKKRAHTGGKGGNCYQQKKRFISMRRRPLSGQRAEGKRLERGSRGTFKSRGDRHMSKNDGSHESR